MADIKTHTLTLSELFNSLGSFIFEINASIFKSNFTFSGEERLEI